MRIGKELEAVRLESHKEKEAQEEARVESVA